MTAAASEFRESEMMKFNEKYLKLYAVTDRQQGSHKPLEVQVEEALLGGVTMVQLREKHMDEDAFIEEAVRIKKITDRFGVPLIINDNITVCLKSGASGVHVGQSDMEAGHVREILGKDRIIGVTAKTPEQAQAAKSAGADYIGCGAVFGSATKLDTNKISLAQLDAVCDATDLPVVAIGGINCHNVSELEGHKMKGIAVVSALFAREDVTEEAGKLCDLVEKYII